MSAKPTSLTDGSPITAELLDVQALRALPGGISTRTIYRLADSGKMPFEVRLGHLRRWRRSELLEWLSRGCPRVR